MDWTGADVDLSTLLDIFPVNSGFVLHLHGNCGQTSIALYDGKELRKISVEGASNFDAVWPGEGNSFLAQFGDAIWSLSILPEFSVTKAKLVDLNADAIEVQATWVEGSGVVVVTFEDKNIKIEDDSPIVIPPPRRDLTLSVYRPMTGWVDFCQCPKESEELRISPNGRRCVWRVMKNYVPEEAERGEIWGCDISSSEMGLGPTQLTEDAGRVGHAILSDDGVRVVYTANYSRERPITTHLDLWAVTFPRPTDTAPPIPTKLVDRCGGVAHVRDFKLVHGNMIVDLSSAASPLRTLAPPSSSASIAFGSGGFLYSTESVTEYPMLFDGAREERMPLGDLPPGFETLRVTPVRYAARDGTEIVGMFCSSDAFTTPDSPLLVHAHGGPAVDFPILRSCAALAARYPYRHLIKQGYNIFFPHFRGTLGFGDGFSSANIKSQGSVDGDLGDLMAGMDHLLSLGLVASLERHKVGIFGGSYGGYMTMRAVSTFPSRFGAAVAMWGFVHGRMMSLESGDFTWEDEYTGPQCWPLPLESTASDVFEHLHKVNCPMLFLHGADDPICPKSQSLMAYRILSTNTVPTGLVLYPGEKHGFKKLKNRKDRDVRILEWFSKYLKGKE